MLGEEGGAETLAGATPATMPPTPTITNTKMTTRSSATAAETVVNAASMVMVGNESDSSHGQKRKRRSKKTTTQLGTKTREAKAATSDDELKSYFQKILAVSTDCGNKCCGCLHILSQPAIQSVVANHLVEFERKSKNEQDSALLEWYKYASANRGKRIEFLLPYRVDKVEENNTTFMKTLKACRLCMRGFGKVMQVGNSRLKAIKKAASSGGVI